MKVYLLISYDREDSIVEFVFEHEEDAHAAGNGLKLTYPNWTVEAHLVWRHIPEPVKA